MTRHLVLGTAGHIDHGKTRLVAALTGIDTDRLPEEKQRGITIDLGFARLDIDSYRFSLIDVPGHERFIRNMLAGSTAIDMALLVIAADESVMPQTREHLSILDLLGVKHGVIAITKTDLVDDELIELVKLETAELIEHSGLRDAAIVPVSAHTGAGLEALKRAIVRATTDVPPQQASPMFRMHIDRKFTAHGHGSVVTGTVCSGVAEVGHTLEWLPSGEAVTIRQLQHHGKATQRIGPGQRAAINLAGVAADSLSRGQVLASPGYLKPSRWLAVSLSVLPNAPFPIRHRTDYRMHIGTDEIVVDVRLLSAKQVGPGESVDALLVCADPVTALGGDAFVLRACSPRVTLGGGAVLLPLASPFPRKDQTRRDWLAALRSDDLSERVAAAVGLHGISGCDLRGLWRCVPIDQDRLLETGRGLVDSGELVAASDRDNVFVHRLVLERAGGRVIGTLKRLHEAHPLEARIPIARLASALGNDLPVTTVSWVVRKLCGAGRLTGNDLAICLPGHEPRLTKTQRDKLARCVQAVSESGLQPPRISDLAGTLGLRVSELQALIDHAVADGRLVRIDGEWSLSPDAHDRMLRVTQEALRARGHTISEFRQLLRITRKHALPFGEYLDRIGLTKRRGDTRVLAQGSET